MPLPDDIVTVRIPELPPTSEDHPLTDDDTLPIWSADDNITRHTKLSTLRSYIETGASTGINPVVNGAKVLYIVPASDAGGTVASIPFLAGEFFNLRRDGQPMIPETDPSGSRPAEYRVLSSGGFQLLTPGELLVEGQRYELEVYTAVAGGTTSQPISGGGGSFITGKVVVTTNLTMTVSNHLRKLIQLRANTAKIVLTLPSITDIPVNTIIPIEASVLNTWQNRITTQGGQSIYMNNQSYNSLYISPGETIMLFRDDDGFYVIDDFGSNYKAIGRIQTVYKIGMDELLANGQLVNRADYPRLWEWVQSLGSSLVNDTLWNTASVTVSGREVLRPYRGCYSTGNGTTTFRLPDLMNVALRGLKNQLGTDGERYFNRPGGFQRHEFESHRHETDLRGDATGEGLFSKHDGDGGSSLYPSSFVGGAETRMDNVGIYWTIKI